MNEFVPGGKLCHCTLLTRCGAGAYGEVWLAKDEVDALVAVKIVQNRGKYSERETAGLHNYRKCDHPNLLRIRHIEIRDDFLLYTMDAADDLHHGKGDYLPDTLANRLRLFKRLDGCEITEMLEGLLSGLSELHRHNLVHRDIKPDNILWVNGRPTLADAGLITPSGAGSLAGTPGFLSPRLLSGKGSAEPEDDFYALGKVIYCALTGNPVEKYPSIPSDLTLSGNADWNRLFSEICEAPVSTDKEFLEKMQFRPEKTRRHLWGWVIGALSFILILSAASSVFFRAKNVPAEPDRAADVPQPSSIVRKEDALSSDVVRKWADGSSQVMSAFKAAGLYDAEQLDALLSVPWYSRNDFFSRIEKCEQNPRMTGFPRYRTDKKASPLEKEIASACRDYSEISLGDLKSRQTYWYACQGDALTVQRTMLAEDAVMQKAALDHLVFSKIDQALSSNSLEEKDKELLIEWISLKNAL